MGLATSLGGRGLGGDVGGVAEHEHGLVIANAVLIGGGGTPEKLDKAIIQAGTSVDANPSGVALIPFREPFPNGLISVVAVAGDSTGPEVRWTRTYSLSDFWIDFTATGIVRINWIAIGW